MKHTLRHRHHQLNPKYNPHLKPNYHSKLRKGKHVLACILLFIMSLVIILALVAVGGIWLYRNANDQARQKVAAKVERNARPKEPVYDQESLDQRSDHLTDADLVRRYHRIDGNFVSKMTYNPKKDVARVTLKRPAAQAIKYASDNKKPDVKRLTSSIKTGVKIDNRLSNQAVEISNQAHDGYFTFQFANANGYQAPNTKSGSYKE